MITIRAFQMDAFSKAADAAFEKRVVDFLQGRFDDARAMPRPELTEGVRAQIARAGGYGLTTERQVAIYVTTAWILGIDFDTRMPYFRDVLRAGAIDPDRKAEILADRTEEIIATLQGRA